MRRRDLSVFQKRESLMVISDTANPAPSRLHSCRNGLSVTPAMGARITGVSMRCGPICMPAILPAAQAPDATGPGRRARIRGQAVSSTTSASGALLFTEAMPLSRPDSDSYISLVPMTCPLPASRLKKNLWLLDTLRS